MITKEQERKSQESSFMKKDEEEKELRLGFSGDSLIYPKYKQKTEIAIDEILVRKSMLEFLYNMLGYIKNTEMNPNSINCAFNLQLLLDSIAPTDTEWNNENLYPIPVNSIKTIMILFNAWIKNTDELFEEYKDQWVSVSAGEQILLETREVRVERFIVEDDRLYTITYDSGTYQTVCYVVNQFKDILSGITDSKGAPFGRISYSDILEDFTEELIKKQQNEVNTRTNENS